MSSEISDEELRQALQFLADREEDRVANTLGHLTREFEDFANRSCLRAHHVTAVESALAELKRSLIRREMLDELKK
jgi:hypothetical protein